MFGNPDYVLLRPSNAIFGLYDAAGSGGNPGALLAATDIVNVSAVTTYTFDFNSHPTVPAGKFWMMALYDSFSSPRSQYPSESGYVYFARPFADGMPAAAPSDTFVSSINVNFNYWINGTPVPEPAAFLIAACAFVVLPTRRRKSLSQKPR
jgi:hypothetical protein